MIKLSQRSGFTITELLVTLVIVSLVGIAVAFGISAAGKAYVNVTMSSEAAVLSGTLAAEIADELRFAEEIQASGAFTSRRFGANVSVASADGRVTIGGNPILSDKAYTGLNADANVNYNGGVFEVTITIKGATGNELMTSTFSAAPISG